MRNLFGRLRRNQRGTTLSESLIALLIISLVSVLVAEGVTLVQHVYANLVDRSDANVLLSTTATLLREELAMATDAVVDSDGCLQYYISAKYAAPAAIRSYDWDTLTEGMPSPGLYLELFDSMEAWKAQTSFDATVMPSHSVRLPVLSANRQTLYPGFESITYDAHRGLFTVTNLFVKKGNQILASEDCYIILHLNA